MEEKSGTTINKLFCDFRDKIITKRDFEGKLYEQILNRPETVGLFGESKEACIELLCGLYPRLSRSIDNYNPEKGKFTTYINNMIQFAKKENKTRSQQWQEREYAFLANRLQEKMLHESEAEFLGQDMPCYLEYINFKSEKTIAADEECKKESKKEGKKRPGTVTFTEKQILILVLKSYYFLSESFIERIAERSGIDKKIIHLYIERLHFMRLKKETSITKAQQKHDVQQLRCIVSERKLQKCEKNTLSYRVLEEKVNKKREKLKKTGEKFKAMRREASNREVGIVLGISKGTVDSNLFLIRQKWDQICKINTKNTRTAGVSKGFIRPFYITARQVLVAFIFLIFFA